MVSSSIRRESGKALSQAPDPGANAAIRWALDCTSEVSKSRRSILAWILGKSHFSDDERQEVQEVVCHFYTMTTGLTLPKGQWRLKVKKGACAGPD